MLSIFALILALGLLMRFGPDIPFKALLNEQLVSRPLRWLFERRNAPLLCSLIVLAVFVGGGNLLLTEPELLATVLLGGGEMILVMGPDLALWYAAEVALYVDAVMLSYLLTTLVSLRAAVRTIRAYIIGWYGRVFRCFGKGTRLRKSRKPKLSSRAVNDDERESRVTLPLAA